EEVVEPEEEPETEPEDESEVEPEEEDALEDEEVSEDETTDPEQKVEEEKEVEVLVLEKPEIDEKIEIRQEKVEEEIEEPPFIPEIFLSNLDIESSSGKQGALAEQGDVLGAKDSSEKLGYCRYRFNMTLEIIVRERCKMDNPVVSRIDHPLAEKIHWIDVEVTVAQTM